MAENKDMNVNKMICDIQQGPEDLQPMENDNTDLIIQGQKLPCPTFRT
jgi:hypothetical protein